MKPDNEFGGPDWCYWTKGSTPYNKAGNCVGPMTRLQKTFQKSGRVPPAPIKTIFFWLCTNCYAAAKDKPGEEIM